ncbi:MAG: branched-chain amino acid transaminase [Alphaproteobacteria bacterium]|nr:branched-chain amino acid transaminase [Alphaproteobacteria bacterium]
MEAIPFDKRDGYIWYDGNFVEWQSANIHVLNHGFQYGSCVFEGERIYQGKIFKSEEHTKRILESAAFLDIAINFKENEINQAKIDLVKKQGLANAYMKMFAWKGCDHMTVESIGGRSHFAIALWEMHSDYSSVYKKRGIKICTSNWLRPDPRSFPVHIKFSGAYVVNTLAKHEAVKKGYDDAMMLDCDGYIAEGTAANIFFIIKNELHTPAPGGFLDGVTRRTVIDIAKSKGIKVIERKIKPDEIKNFEGAFFTGTSVEITPIRQIDSKEFGLHQLAQSISSYYNAFVNGELQV